MDVNGATIYKVIDSNWRKVGGLLHLISGAYYKMSRQKLIELGV